MASTDGHKCVYCGRPTAKGRACSYCDDLEEAEAVINGDIAAAPEPAEGELVRRMARARRSRRRSS